MMPTETTESDATSNVAPIIGGVVAGVIIVVLIAVIVVVIIIVCCVRKVTRKSSAIFSSSNGNRYDEDPDALYSMIPKRDVPPPLPTRPIPGTYATVDSKDSEHVELLKMGAPSLRDSIISMPAEVNGSQQDPALVKLSMNGNNQSFPLRNNPLYSSADNLIQNAPPLPDRSFTSSAGNFDETNLNIYAIPHKPPPLPNRMFSPELKETSPAPNDKESALTPAHFRRDSAIGSPDSGKVCPYASIYADPKPLLKEEGPIEVRPYHIKEISLLGTGQFGEVILAETLGLSMKDLKLGDSTNKSAAIRVAVKRLKHDADKTVKEAFEKEVKFMARLNHMNVIRLLAICPTGHPFILIEYMEYGDLNQYLQRYKVAPYGAEPTANQIKVATLLYACVQIANGMRYLASLHFIHRDLATRNCLVGQDNSIKIADFGMSRSLYSSHYYRIQGRAVLPIRWMANECFYGRFSEKTDVWAFGVVMWEVFTLAKEQPYSLLSDQEVIENAVNTEKMKLLSKPEHCPEEVYEVMLQCWEKEPDARINFEDVYSSLAALHSYSDL